MDLNVNKVEKKWLNEVFKASADCFKDANLPSHDHWHHYRVWIYAKELLNALSLHNELTENELTNLLIACFFHDTGMTITKDEKHGKEGAILCKHFFHNSQIQMPANLETAIKAIEHHDDKSYKQGNSNPCSLITILASADDLDAYGYIGILRYAEIYLLRDIPMEELSEKVVKNAETRFNNFENNFRNCKKLITRHKKRLNILLDFYNNMPQKNYNRKIIEQVNKNIRRYKPQRLEDLVEDKTQKDKFLSFKNNLTSELNHFQNPEFI